jgi:hypothetical protein
VQLLDRWGISFVVSISLPIYLLQAKTIRLITLYWQGRNVKCRFFFTTPQGKYAVFIKLRHIQNGAIVSEDAAGHESGTAAVAEDRARP